MRAIRNLKERFKLWIILFQNFKNNFREQRKWSAIICYNAISLSIFESSPIYEISIGREHTAAHLPIIKVKFSSWSNISSFYRQERFQTSSLNVSYLPGYVLTQWRFLIHIMKVQFLPVENISITEPWYTLLFSMWEAGVQFPGWSLQMSEWTIHSSRWTHLCQGNG